MPGFYLTLPDPVLPEHIDLDLRTRVDSTEYLEPVSSGLYEEIRESHPLSADQNPEDSAVDDNASVIYADTAPECEPLSRAEDEPNGNYANDAATPGPKGYEPTPGIIYDTRYEPSGASPRPTPGTTEDPAAVYEDTPIG